MRGNDGGLATSERSHERTSIRRITLATATRLRYV